MMTIGPNKYQLYLKIIVLVIDILLIGLFVIKTPRIDADYISRMILTSILFFVMFLVLFMIAIQLLILPISIEINEGSNSIVLHFLISNSVLIHLEEITEFSEFSFQTKFSVYEGILVKINGKEYMFSNFNLVDYDPVLSFLKNTNIPFSGKKKFNMIKYFASYLKVIE